MSGALKWSRLYFWGDSWWLSPKLNPKMQQRLPKPPLVKTRNVFILFKKFHIFSFKLLYSCVPNFHSEWFEVTCNQFIFGNKMTLPQKQLRLLCSVNVNLLNFQKKKKVCFLQALDLSPFELSCIVPQNSYSIVKCSWN